MKGFNHGRLIFVVSQFLFLYAVYCTEITASNYGCQISIMTASQILFGTSEGVFHNDKGILDTGNNYVTSLQVCNAWLVLFGILDEKQYSFKPLCG